LDKLGVYSKNVGNCIKVGGKDRTGQSIPLSPQQF